MLWPHTSYAKSTIEYPTCQPHILCMTMIHDALTDLRNDALAGKPLAFAEIAKDYDINPELLKRKFYESYPNGVVGKLQTTSESITEKVNAQVEKYCQMYNVPKQYLQVREIRGTKYTIIGTRPGAKKFNVLAVSHKDGLGYKVKF